MQPICYNVKGPSIYIIYSCCTAPWSYHNDLGINKIAFKKAPVRMTLSLSERGLTSILHFIAQRLSHFLSVIAHLERHGQFQAVSGDN